MEYIRSPIINHLSLFQSHRTGAVHRRSFSKGVEPAHKSSKHVKSAIVFITADAADAIVNVVREWAKKFIDFHLARRVILRGELIFTMMIILGLVRARVVPVIFKKRNRSQASSSASKKWRYSSVYDHHRARRDIGSSSSSIVLLVQMKPR